MTLSHGSKQTKPIPWEVFLASHPPGGKWFPVAGLAKANVPLPKLIVVLKIPFIQLYCEECKGIRIFEGEGTLIGGPLVAQKVYEEILDYVCRNCKKYLKKFAILLSWPGDGLDGEALKLGEYPPFGPQVPARVLRLIQPDKELFLSGRRAENQGMGIGAFAYYRRVVENQKSRIIDEILKVAQRIKAPDETVKTLALAREEKQFKNAVESIKDAIPQPLLIDGHHNPLILLHDALSQGLHAQTDEECLQSAADIRIVLTDLAECLGEALKEKTELDTAVKRLMKARSKKKNK